MTSPVNDLNVLISAQYAPLAQGMQAATRIVDQGVAQMNASLGRLTSVRALMTPQDAAVYDRLSAQMRTTATSAQTLVRATDGVAISGAKAALKLAATGAAIAQAGTISAGTAEKLLNAGSSIASMFGPNGLAIAAIGTFAAVAISRLTDTRREMEATEQQFKKSLREMINAGDVEAIKRELRILEQGTPAEGFKDGIQAIQKRLEELGSLYDATLGGVVENERSREIRRLQRELAPLITKYRELEAAINDVQNVPRKTYAPDPFRVTGEAPGKKSDAKGGRLSSQEKDAEALSRAQYEREVAMAAESFQRRLQLAQDWLDQTSAVYGTGSVEYVNALAEVERIEREHNRARIDADREVAEQKEKAQREKLEKAIELDRQYYAAWMDIQAEVARVQRDYIDSYRADWEAALATVTNAIERSFDGVIAGTTRLEDAFRNLGRNILLQMAQNVAESIRMWLAAEITKRTLGKASAKQTVMNSAVEAAARAWSATVGIPVVGPVLAPIASAASFAGVLALGANIASAAGGWANVPSDQLAMIHKNEMVLPASLAEGIRQMTAGQMQAGGRGGNTYIVQGLDAQSIEDALTRHGSSLVRVLEGIGAEGRLGMVGG